MPRVCGALCLTLVIFGAIGCSNRPAPIPTAAVKGTITMDGKPLRTGELHFGAPGAPPSVLVVKDGTFSGEAAVGQNVVELFILTEAPANPKYKEPGTANKTNTAPGKYWGPGSVLRAEVSSSGPNEFKFDVSSR